MTTPQNQLYNLADRIKRLTEMFEGDEEESSIFETIQQIELQMQDIMAGMTFYMISPLKSRRFWRNMRKHTKS